MRKIIHVLIAILLISVLAGCANDSKDTENKTESRPKHKVAKQKTDQAEETAPASEIPAPEEEKPTLVERLCGKYSFRYNEEECTVLNLFTFGDNLYAFAGDAMSEEGDETPEVYSFWVMELLPEKTADLRSIDTDACDVYVLTFSVMSNLTKYWSAPQAGRIELTDDGILFDGKHYVKDERVEDVFPYHKGSGKVDPDLMGLWRQKGTEAPLYFDFDGQTVTIYQKSPGTEVFFGRGGYEADGKKITGTYSVASSAYQPSNLEAEYSLTQDGTLTLHLTDVILDHPEQMELERITEDEIPVITLQDARAAGLTEDREYDMYAQSEETVSTVDEEPFYGVWVSAFTERADAEKIVDALSDKGFNASIVFSPDWENLSPKAYHCVTAGRFMSEEEADRALEQVKEAGYKDAYVKSSGKRKEERVYYTLYSLDRGSSVQIEADRVILKGVQVDDLSGEEPLTMNLIIDKNSGFDKSCNMQFFENYQNGDSAFDWFVRNADSEEYEDYSTVLGVFDVSITGDHIDSYYGSYWWD
ncbi:MAG: SPOR domain-containing protein [Lachnospiraceae bacterium]|nr:SPOR domain-containing protein [Lachnospiraceae bacterium]